MMLVQRRRLLFASSALIASPLVSFAQPNKKVWRIGFLYSRSGPTPSNPDVFLDAFVQRMRELGYVEGKNLIIEWRFAEGHNERLPGLAMELAQTKNDVIVTHSTMTTLAAKRASSTIPIVFASLTDPVVSGVVKSLARPEGNITGLSMMFFDVIPKQIELLAAIVPRLSRIAFLMNPDTPLIYAPLLKNAQATAQQIGVNVLPVEARRAEEVVQAFVTMAGWGAQAVIIPVDPFYGGQRQQIAQLGLKYQTPTMMNYPQDAEAGVLLSYGQDLLDFYPRAAGLVDRILKGAKPGDMPVEQPTTFRFVVNLKTAKALGIKIPQSVLIRADTLIE